MYRRVVEGAQAIRKRFQEPERERASKLAKAEINETKESNEQLLQGMQVGHKQNSHHNGDTNDDATSGAPTLSQAEITVAALSFQDPYPTTGSVQPGTSSSKDSIAAKLPPAILTQDSGDNDDHDDDDDDNGDIHDRCKNQQQGNANKKKQQKQCLACKESIPDNQEFCNDCNVAMLPDAKLPPAILTQESNDEIHDRCNNQQDMNEKKKQKKLCLACKESISDNQEFCNDCNAAMLPEHDINIDVPPEKVPASPVQVQPRRAAVPVTPFNSKEDQGEEGKQEQKRCQDCGNPMTDAEHNTPRCNPCLKVFTSPINHGNAVSCKLCGRRVEIIRIAWSFNFCCGCIRMMAEVGTGSCAVCHKGTGKKYKRFCSGCYGDIVNRPNNAANVTPVKRRLNFDAAVDDGDAGDCSPTVIGKHKSTGII